MNKDLLLDQAATDANFTRSRLTYCDMKIMNNTPVVAICVDDMPSTFRWDLDFDAQIESYTEQQINEGVLDDFVADMSAYLIGYE
jgi:hypothetical protein